MSFRYYWLDYILNRPFKAYDVPAVLLSIIWYLFLLGVGIEKKVVVVKKDE